MSQTITLVTLGQSFRKGRRAAGWPVEEKQRAEGNSRRSPFPDFSEVNMKAILSMALVLVVCGLAGAADKVDPVGTWKCEYDIGGQKRTSTLTIKKDADKLAGTMSWPDQKDANLKDLKLKDGALTFVAERKLMDNTFAIEYKLTIDGDMLKGKGALEIGGEKRAFDIEGKREKKDK